MNTREFVDGKKIAIVVLCLNSLDTQLWIRRDSAILISSERTK